MFYRQHHDGEMMTSNQKEETRVKHLDHTTTSSLIELWQVPGHIHTRSNVQNVLCRLHVPSRVVRPFSSF